MEFLIFVITSDKNTKRYDSTQLTVISKESRRNGLNLDKFCFVWVISGEFSKLVFYSAGLF